MDSKTCQTYKMVLFAKIINNLKPLFILGKETLWELTEKISFQEI